ncbi:MAG: hypothetical protein MPL62_13770, partial [Alphaproteobacteria bacterium]|nr:hypothetical protein [Alphaproteobacteria bacterium]
MDTAAVGSDWGSGEELPVSVTDNDLNKNSLVEEYLVSGGSDVIRSTTDLGDDPELSVQLGSDGAYVSLPPSKTVPMGVGDGGQQPTPASTRTNAEGVSTVTVTAGVTAFGSDKAAWDPSGSRIPGDIFDEGLEEGNSLFLEYDISGLGPNVGLKFWVDGGNGGDFFMNAARETFPDLPNKGNVRIDNHPLQAGDLDNNGFAGGAIRIGFRNMEIPPENQGVPITIKILLKLYENDAGVPTLKETGPNTGVFDGTIEYIQLNQLNTNADGTANTRTADMATDLTEDTVIILDGDYTDEDGIRVDYVDRDEQGQETVVSVKTDAPTHSGSISLDQDNYKQADTVKVELEDADLNVNNELRDVYTAIPVGTNHANVNRDTIARTGSDPTMDPSADNAESGLLLEATFDDNRWISCTGGGNPGFGTLIGSIRETAPTSGIFVADFQVPPRYCTPDAPNAPETTLGKDLEVSYHDYFDGAGERNEVGDVAGITSFTGSVSLDRSVYPVPFADGNDVTSNAVFAYHESLDSAATETHVSGGDVVIHIQVNDKDLDQSGSGTDTLTLAADDPATTNVVEPSTLTVEITRGSDTATPASASSLGGTAVRETSPTSGIFELDLDIVWDDGPSEGCPPGEFTGGCLLQGDIITVTYRDESDATGNVNTVTDSATFDLRNGVLQSDKSVYIIGSDMILTLIDPDLDLDNDGKQSYSLDLIEWDSDAATLTMGDGGQHPAVFDPEPAKLQETGDSTGIFQ